MKTRNYIVVVFSGLMLSLFTPGCSNQSNLPDEGKTYEEQRMSVADHEKGNPNQFLKTDASSRENLTGTTVVEGEITNNATIANYKDVVVEVTFYDEARNALGSSNYTLDETFPAGQTKDFKLKIDSPEGTSSVSWNIVNAKTE